MVDLKLGNKKIGFCPHDDYNYTHVKIYFMMCVIIITLNSFYMKYVLSG